MLSWHWACHMLTHSDGHSGATSATTFSIGVAAALLLFFVTRDKRQRRCFLTEKAAALQCPILSKFSAAAATANKLLARLFRFTFHTLPFGVFTLRLFSLCSSLVERTRLSFRRFVLACICIVDLFIF